MTEPHETGGTAAPDWVADERPWSELRQARMTRFEVELYRERAGLSPQEAVRWWERYLFSGEAKRAIDAGQSIDEAVGIARDECRRRAATRRVLIEVRRSGPDGTSTTSLVEHADELTLVEDDREVRLCHEGVLEAVRARPELHEVRANDVTRISINRRVGDSGGVIAQLQPVADDAPLGISELRWPRELRALADDVLPDGLVVPAVFIDGEHWAGALVEGSDLLMLIPLDHRDGFASVRLRSSWASCTLQVCDDVPCIAELHTLGLVREGVVAAISCDPDRRVCDATFMVIDRGTRVEEIVAWLRRLSEELGVDLRSVASEAARTGELAGGQLTPASWPLARYELRVAVEPRERDLFQSLVSDSCRNNRPR